MFNIGFAELLLILVIAYVIVGPKDLPKVARWLGRMVRYARQMIGDLKAEVGWDEMMNETQDVRRDIEGVMKDADIRKDLTDAQKTLQQSLREAEKDTMKKPAGGNSAGAAPAPAGREEKPRESADRPLSFKEWESRKRKERAEALTEKRGAEQTGEAGGAERPEHPEARGDTGKTAQAERPEQTEITERPDRPEIADNKENATDQP